MRGHWLWIILVMLVGAQPDEATTLDDLDPIDVFWPTYDGVFAVTPSSTIGRVSWPPAAIGSLGQVLLEVEYDDDREGDQTQERSESVGRESVPEFSARRAPSLPRLQVWAGEIRARELEFIELLPEIGPGAHVLKVRAEIHAPAADVLRGARWGGEGTDAANGAGAKIAVAERLMLFRICPLTVEVAKLRWAPSLAAAPWSLGERSEADNGKFVIGYAARRVRVELEVSANCGGTIVDLQDGIQLDIARVEVRRAVIQGQRSESADPHPTGGAGRVSSRPLPSADNAAGAGAESSAWVDAASVDDGLRQAFAAAGEPIEVDLPRCISQHSDGCAREQGPLELDLRIQDREHVEGVARLVLSLWRRNFPDGHVWESAEFGAGQAAAGAAGAHDAGGLQAEAEDDVDGCGGAREGWHAMGAADSATAACAKAGAAAAAVLIYHSQPLATYPEEWLEEFVASIAGQTMQDYDVWELDYSGDAARNLSLVRRFGMRVPRAHIWMQKECTSHSEAINYLFSLVRKHAYKAVFNTHVDDIYEAQRFELQLQGLMQGGRDMIASGFQYIHSSHQEPLRKDRGQIFLSSTILHWPADRAPSAVVTSQRAWPELWSAAAQETWIRYRVAAGQNVLCNSGMAWGPAFLASGAEFDRPPDEDLRMWMQALERLHLSVAILPQILTLYRRHERQTAAMLQRESDDWHHRVFVD